MVTVSNERNLQFMLSVHFNGLASMFNCIHALDQRLKVPKILLDGWNSITTNLV